jgi:hypothetical protein
MGVLLDDAPARRVPVSAVCRYRVSLQRKKRCQQIIGLDDESFPIALCIDAKNPCLVKCLAMPLDPPLECRTITQRFEYRFEC